MATLHIYAQAHWHDEAIIAGDTAGLTALRDALNDALSRSPPALTEKEAMVNDGEGYTLEVLHLTEPQADRLDTPYKDREAVGGPDPRVGCAYQWVIAFHRAKMRDELAAGCRAARRAEIEKNLRHQHLYIGDAELARYDALIG